MDMRAAVASLLVALSASAADLPRYWMVHIDKPADQRAFDRLDAAYYGAIRNYYKSQGLTPPPVMIFALADGSHYGLRPRGSLADFEKPSALNDAQRRKLAEMTGPISEATHRVLATHHSEIWEIDGELSTASVSSAPKYLLLRTDYVRPSRLETYAREMKTLVGELKGVQVLAFTSAYGDGAIRYVFMSNAPINVRRLRDVLTTDAEATPRPDLSGGADRWLPF